MADNKFESREPQFAEYSLWNDSTYTMFNSQPFNRIEFMRPVASSIFLSPPNFEFEYRSNDEVEEDIQQDIQGRTRNSPGFERYMKRALKVVTREDLFKDPALFKKDPESDEEPGQSTARAVRNQDLYLRPPRPRWRTTQQVTGRGRRMNLMQRRLEQALSQPAKIDRGASMMQRMGWEGGALGRDGVGIMEPIAPDPYYANTTAGFGLATDSAGEDSGSEEILQRTKGPKQKKGPQKQPKMKMKNFKQEFKTNVLQYIREFVKNDLQIELFFEAKLKPIERKRIHQIVAKLMGDEEEGENEVELSGTEILLLVEDIERRNAYALGTQSEGSPPNRQICIYKEATEHMYLVTPDDVRRLKPDESEEETNPFLKSIAKHLRDDTVPEKEYTMLDRIIDYFVEFSEQDTYTEFRFLGAYNIDEIDVMSSFFGMVSCIIKKGSYVDCPERLVRAFEKGVDYTADEDPNGFVSIKKWFKPDEDKKKDTAEEEIIDLTDG